MSPDTRLYINFASCRPVAVGVNAQWTALPPHLEGARGHVVASAKPHLLDQLGVGLCDLPPHAQRVLPVELHFVLVVQEVVCECGGVAQALERKTTTESTEGKRYSSSF